jgi:NAD(P)-dependent dehydrogenase (short-subunit alcohol dehydrogenase family)
MHGTDVASAAAMGQRTQKTTQSTQGYQLLAGKSVLVTGGSTGIGEAISKLCAKHGASVLVNGLTGDPVQEVAQEIRDTGGIATPFVGDVGTVEGSAGCVQAAVSAYGKLDAVVANAGLYPEAQELQDFPLERFEELIHTNIRGVYLTVRAALPELQKTRGAVVTMGSEAGLVGQPEMVSYCSTKGWIHAFTRALATEQAKYGIRANIVAPGPIDTEMTRPSKGNMTVKHALMAVKGTPLGRRGTPEEVANVCLFLLSDLASYVTGAIYTVDGGATATSGLPGMEAKAEAKTAPEGTVELRHQHEGRGTLHH